MARIEIPQANLIQGYQSGGEGSPAAAAAPWVAVENVGNQIQDQSDQLNQTLVKLQRVKNLKMANDMELNASEEFAAFQREMATNPNPESWPDLWAKRLDKLKSAHMPDNLAPEQQAMIGERFGQFASKTRDSILERSVMEGIGQARQSAANVIDHSFKIGDPDLGLRAINDLEETGMASKPEAEKMRMTLMERQQVAEVEQLAEADPLGTKEALEEKNEDGTWKNYTDLDPNQRGRLADIAKGQYREAMAMTIEDVQNGMSDGSITKLEHLKRYEGLVSPRVMEKLQGELVDRWDSAKQMERAQPSYQNEVVGKVSSMLSTFRAEDADFDEKFVEMDSLVRTLPPGAAKDELSRQLGVARSGQAAEAKTAVDMARKTLQDDYERGFFGQVRKQQSTGAAIDAGLLRDRDKLKAAGFNEESLEYITGKNADGDYTSEGKKLSDTERRKRFAEKYPQRIDKKTADNPFLQSSFEAIQKGSSVVSWTDEQAEKRAQQNYGEVRADLEDWAKLNPEDAKDPEKLAKKIHALTKPFGARNASASILAPLPVFDVVPGEGFDDQLPPLDMDPDYPLLPPKPTR